MEILVIVAHPDDEVLGVGGTILRHSKNSDNVSVVYLATGIFSRRKSSHKNIDSYQMNQSELKKMKKEAKNLQNDAKAATKILKVKNIEFYDFPDNEMDSIPLLKIIKIIENIIKKIKPDRIYTHSKGDLNVDHRVIFDAVLTACRPINKSPEIISFEVPSSTEWNYPYQFNPNYFVNITNEINNKIKSMEKYKNEIRKFPHPRSSHYIKINAERWGAISGMRMAEAFEIIRKIEQ